MEDFLGGVFGLLLCGGILAAIIGALVFLVNKTKEQEQRTKLQLQELLKTLPEASQTAFVLHYNSQKKNPTAAVVLALLLGGLGAHRFYLNQIGIGILYLVFSWTFIPAIIAFFEAFTLPHTVHKHNQKMAQEAAALIGGNVKFLLD